MFVGAGVASAQSVVHVHGRVVDGHGTAVRGAAVSVEGSDAAVKTDAKGEYTIDAAPGASLLVLADGFGAGLGTAADKPDDIVLLAEPRRSRSTAIRRAATAGAVHLDRETAERMPGTGNDVMRTLTAMPGVVDYPLPLGVDGVVMRGSSPQDSKVLVDDFEVPRLYHDSASARSCRAESIDSLEYIPGGFDVVRPRDLGYRRLTTRAGGDKRGSRPSSAPASQRARAGPVGTAHYMISVRRSTIDLLLPSCCPSGLDLVADDGAALLRRADARRLRAVEEVDAARVEPRLRRRDGAVREPRPNPDKRFLNRDRFVRGTAAAPITTACGPRSSRSRGSRSSRCSSGAYQHLDESSPSVTARAEVLAPRSTSPGLDAPVVERRRRGGRRITRSTSRCPQQSARASRRRADDPTDTSLHLHGHGPTLDIAAGRRSPRRSTRACGYRRLARRRVRATNDVAVQPRSELEVTLTPQVTRATLGGCVHAAARVPDGALDRALQGERSRQLIAGLQIDPPRACACRARVYYTRAQSLITRDMMTAARQRRPRHHLRRGGARRRTTRAVVRLAVVLVLALDAHRRAGHGARLFDYDQPHSLNVAGSASAALAVRRAVPAALGPAATPVVDAIFDSDANIYYPSTAR